MDAAQELLKLGVAGLIDIFLLWALIKSEKREAAKDLRIQYLEHQLIESYDERIAAAETLSDAMHENAKAILKLTYKVQGTDND